MAGFSHLNSILVHFYKKCEKKKIAFGFYLKELGTFPKLIVYESYLKIGTGN